MRTVYHETFYVIKINFKNGTVFIARQISDDSLISYQEFIEDNAV